MQEPDTPKDDNSEGSLDPQRDFEELMADDDLTEEKLQERLKAYQQAYKEEFEVALKNDEALANVETYTRDFFKKNVSEAAAQIVWLSQNSTSDSVRLAACKLVVSEALIDSRSDGDGINEIIKKLQSSSKKTPDRTPSENG